MVKSKHEKKNIYLKKIRAVKSPYFNLIYSQLPLCVEIKYVCKYCK